MPSNLTDTELKVIGLDRVSYEKLRSSFEADLDLMGVHEFLLVLIKHYSLNKKEDILEAVKRAGLRIVASKRYTFDRMDAVRLAIIRAQGKGTPLNVQEHTSSLDSLLEGPVEAMIVAGADAIRKILDLVGPEHPAMARNSKPDSLRAKFGGRSLAENGLHCSVQRAEAHQELSLLFPDYVDLLRSRGYASQVDQWLWTLWRGQPHGTIIKSNFLDVSRYPGKDAVRYKEFGQFLAGIAKFLRSLLLAVLTSLSSMWSVPSSTHRIPVLPSASATSVSSVEEVEIARAALADELGVPVIPPFAAMPENSQPAPLRRVYDGPSTSRVHDELGESASESMRHRDINMERDRMMMQANPMFGKKGFSAKRRTGPDAPSSMDMFHPHEEASLRSRHIDRRMMRETSDITDELMDLHAVGELMH